MLKILDKDDPILRLKAKNVALKEIKNLKIKKILKNMKEALASQDDGVAIAAPQIGVSLRITVISGKILNGEDLVCINPVLLKSSREKQIVEEGCLSARYLYGDVSRARKVRVEALNENGKKFEIGGSGLVAQIFQHEIDHLDGVLFIDKARNLRDMPPTPKQ